MSSPPSDTNHHDSGTTGLQETQAVVALTKVNKRERVRSKDEASFAALGRTLARVKQMYGSAGPALREALDKDNTSDDEDPAITTENRDMLEWMSDQCTTIGSVLGNVRGVDMDTTLRWVATTIDKGRQEARNTDTASLRAAVVANFHLPHDFDTFGHWVPALQIKNRSVWGYHHPQLAELLTPEGMDWNSTDARTKLRQPGASRKYIQAGVDGPPWKTGELQSTPRAAREHADPIALGLSQCLGRPCGFDLLATPPLHSLNSRTSCTSNALHINQGTLLLSLISV